MLIQESSLDDILRAVYEPLLRSGTPVTASKGDLRELRGVQLRLEDPRCRLSRSYDRGRVISCLGEFAWYMAGSDDTSFISFYIPRYRDADEGGSIPSAYGPRLRGDGEYAQLNRIIELLEQKRSSRRAVIQLFDRRDLVAGHVEVPCTCTIQFLCRDGALHAYVTMRSNDAYYGLPHDIFAFTMLQEVVARALGVEPGEYVHFVASLHLYVRHLNDAKRFLDEGFQSPEPMPAMPCGNVLSQIDDFLHEEERVRNGGTISLETPSQGYWGDLNRLLYAHQLHKVDDLAMLRRSLSEDYFRLYVADRQARKHREES